MLKSQEKRILSFMMLRTMSSTITILLLLSNPPTPTDASIISKVSQGIKFASNSVRRIAPSIISNLNRVQQSQSSHIILPSLPYHTLSNQGQGIQPLYGHRINAEAAIYSAENKHLVADGPHDQPHLTKVTNDLGERMSSEQWNKRTRHTAIQATDSNARHFRASLESQIETIKQNAPGFHLQEIEKVNPSGKKTKLLVVTDIRTGKPAELTYKVDADKALLFSRPNSKTNQFSVQTNTKETTIKFTLFANADSPNNFHLHLVDSGHSTGAFGEIDKVGSKKFNFPTCTSRRRRDVHFRTKRECSCCQRRKKLTGGDTTEKKQKRIEDKRTKLNEIEYGGTKRAKSGLALVVDKDNSPSSKSHHMTSVESKSNQVSQALETGKKIAQGGIGKLSQTARKAMGKTIKMGANAVKSSFYNLKTRLEGIPTSRGYKKMSKFSGRLGHAFMVKNLGAALRHGDWAGVGTIAGMTGVGLLSAGLQSIKSVTTTGKNMVMVGKGLGGLLNGAGVVFDVISVVHSHKCESSSRNNTHLCMRGAEGCVEEYSICDGKDAMTEVVTSHVQLGLSVASIGLLFTPAAPLAVFIGIFQLGLSYANNKVQARNQLSAFHQYFPLTKSEQSDHLGFFNVQFGFTIAKTLKNMREQSKTNARELDNMGTFLRENNGTFWAYFKPALQGETKTVRNEENCDVYNKLGSLHEWMLFILGGLPAWAIGKEIGKHTHPCEEEVPVDDPSYQDNQVDATNWKSRYFQRWSPIPKDIIRKYSPNKFTEYNFFCRPEGPQIDIDYEKDGPWLHGDSFKCVNSLGYKYQEPTAALMALFDLQNGTDVVIGFSRTPNYFMVNNGRKYFKGGDGSDVFDIIGNRASGRLDGGKGVDSLRIQIPAAVDVHVVLWGAELVLVTSMNELRLELIGIERIEGRAWVADVIHVGCHNTYIDGRGGFFSILDEIHVGEYPCRGLKSPEHVRIVVPPSTSITSYNRGSAPVQYVYIVTSINGTNLHDISQKSTLEIFDGTAPALHHVFLPLPLHQISILRNEKIRDERRMGLRGVGFDFVGTFYNSSQVHVTTVDEALFSYLDDPQESLFFLFNLVDSASRNVVGAENYTNYFHIQNTYKSVTGGGLSDTFLIATDKRVGSIRGGSGGSNTIILSDRLEAQCVVDLRGMEILVTQSNRQISKTKLAGDFETVIGRNGRKDTAVVSCGTKNIDLKMGRESEQDRVTIPHMSCSHPPRMTISVPPFTLVDNQHRGFAHFTYHIPISTFMGPRFYTTLNIAPSAHAIHSVLFKSGPGGPQAVTYVSSKNSLLFNGTALNLEINFTIHNHQENAASVISQPAAIQFEPNDNNVTLEPVFVYSISRNVTENNSTVVGAPNFGNKFEIDGNVTSVAGGPKSDVFNLNQNGRVGRIETGGGNDVLVLSIQNNETSPKYTIDLTSHITISDSNGMATIRSELSGDFTHFYGPSTAIQFIAAACTTKLIHLDGESSVKLLPLQNRNKIRIPKSECFYDLVLLLPAHPTNRHVLNGATKGVFKYVVPLTGTEFVIHRVVQNVTTTENLMEFEENVTQLFMLNVTLFQIEDFAADWEGQKVNLTYFDGRMSSFQILHVTSEETLAPLQLSDADPNDMNTDRNKTSSSKTDEDAELKNSDEIDNEEETTTRRTQFEFSYNFVTSDGFEVTVNHLGGVHAVKTVGGSLTTDEVFDLIQTHVEHANAVGMTIILSSLDDKGAQAQFVQIGGDDEMDFLINQDNVESHLVGNSMGERNVFYIAPTLNNHPIYVYLPASSPSQNSEPPNGDELNSEYSEYDEYITDLDHRHNEGENLLQFSSLYDRRPPHVDPALYEPQIYIPTIEESDGDLIITAEYNPDPNSVQHNSDSRVKRDDSNPLEERKKERVVFVNGVEDFYRLRVKLFSILYEINFDWKRLEQNSPQNETDDTDLFPGSKSRKWSLRPQEFHFPQSSASAQDTEDAEDIDEEFELNLDETDYQLENGTDSNSDEDENVSKIKETTKKRRKKAAEDYVTILSYADILEYGLTGVPVELPQHLTSRENIFASGDDILLTNNLEQPDSHIFTKYTTATHSDEEVEDSPGISIVLVGMKKAMEAKNLTLAFTLTDPSNSSRSESSFQVTPENVTNAFSDVAVAQEEFTEAHAQFENVLVQVQSIKKNFQSDFDTSTNASEGVESAQSDFISYYSNFTYYFDVIRKEEGRFSFWHYWAHSNHSKATEGVTSGERDLRASHSNVVRAYEAFKDAEQVYNSSLEGFREAKEEIEKEGVDFQSSYENLQLAIQQLTGAKTSFMRSSDQFWVAIGAVKESENKFLSVYNLYMEVLGEDGDSMGHGQIFDATQLLFILICLLLTVLIFLGFFVVFFVVNRRMKRGYWSPEQSRSQSRHAPQASEHELQSVQGEHLLSDYSPINKLGSCPSQQDKLL